MRELAVQFGAAQSLVGIVTTPTVPDRGRPSFIFLNSGIMHRVGPNRLHVTIARELAELGFVSFRIDLSGIGDSPASAGSATIWERWLAETREAMDFLTHTQGSQSFVLIGNCLGAAVAFGAASQDARVAGAILINLQGPRTYLRYYLRMAFTSGAMWRRLLTGTGRNQKLFQSVADALGNLRNRVKRDDDTNGVDVHAMVRTLTARNPKLLFVFCSFDPGLDHFKATLEPLLQKQMSREHLDVATIDGMNHDFSLLHGQERLREIVRAWADRLQAQAWAR